MWVFTKEGFFSTVVHRGDPAMVIVRARVRDDLENYVSRMHYITDNEMPVMKIMHTPTADYPYRVICLRSLWAVYLESAAYSMDYDNFKSANSHRSEVYGDVWWALHGLQAAN